MSEDHKIHEGEKPAPSKGNAFEPSVDADRGDETKGAVGDADKIPEGDLPAPSKGNAFKPESDAEPAGKKD